MPSEWYGSVETFEEMVRKRIRSMLYRQLGGLLFPYGWQLVGASPILWGFADLVAARTRVGHWREAAYLGVRQLEDRLAAEDGFAGVLTKRPRGECSLDFGKRWWLTCFNAELQLAEERQAILSYAIGETEAVIDKAEAACHEAKEDADRLSELQGTGLSSSEMSEACQKVAARVAQAEEELDLAKRQAEELGRGDASGLLEDHRTESARLLSRFMKPKQQLTSAKFVLGHWSKQVSARRAVEVQNFGLKVRAALRAASPKAQGTGTELLEGLGDSEGDPLDKDDVAGFVRLRMGEDAPEDLVTSWLDSVTEKQEYKEILTREDLWLLIRICYKVVKPTELTTDSAMDSTSLATLDIGEVVELIGEEVSAAEAEDLHRIRARRLKDGQEGWVTVKGSGGVVVLQPGGDRLCVLKETSLTESLSISGQDAFRLLRVGEILEITGVESIDETSGLLRARVRAMSDGRIGWATKISSSGSVFLRQL
ncbi:Hypothetical protein SCF082_LOCUS41050 [Durusdinium trenchii]|uniref:Uncharacterized protein n=1 Tax=Durusdinium trenchii TaxID=1381693 RepID=A0ABP0QEX9_9DINO